MKGIQLQTIADHLKEFFAKKNLMTMAYQANLYRQICAGIILLEFYEVCIFKPEVVFLKRRS